VKWVEVELESGLKLALAAASVALTLLLAEGFLQLSYRIQHGRWVVQQNAGFRVHFTTPVEDDRRYTLRPGYTSEGLRINDLGFRGTPIPADARVVAVVGDSVPFGSETADDETYPHYLESELKRRGLPHRVLNAAVPSYNLRQSFDQFDREVLSRYQPDIAIVHAANDVFLLAAYGEGWTPNVTWAELRWSKHWRKSTDLIALLGLVDRLRRRADPNAFAEHDTRALVAHLEGMLSDRLAALEDQGISVVLLPINPFYYQVYHRERNASLEQFGEPSFRKYADATAGAVEAVNTILASASQRWPHTYYLDLRASFDELDRGALYHDYVHHTPEGSRVAAEMLADFLVRPASEGGPGLRAGPRPVSASGEENRPE
jgi:lysophospholipase L1-like esterase